MLTAAPSRRLPAAPRELARGAAALLVSLLLLPVWQASGAGETYRAAVVAVAERIVLATQHFPLLASFPGLKPPESDFVILATIALTAVSVGIGWRRRVALLLMALALTTAFQTLAAVATIHLESAQEMERSQRIFVLLPLEFRGVSQAKMILYDAQLAVIFVLFLVTSAWWKSPHEGTTPSRLRLVTSVAALFVVLAGSWLAWGRFREADPRHVAAHAKVGHLFWVKRDDAIAEEQYRVAVAGRTTDPEVYFNLAGIAVRKGRSDEARRMLKRCAELAPDGAWPARVARARELVKRR